MYVSLRMLTKKRILKIIRKSLLLTKRLGKMSLKKEDTLLNLEEDMHNHRERSGQG